jgi:hypothetical protein
MGKEANPEKRTASYEERDQDDWMLFFWTNTKAGRERRRVNEEEVPSLVKTWGSSWSRPLTTFSCAHMYPNRSRSQRL